MGLDSYLYKTTKEEHQENCKLARKLSKLRRDNEKKIEEAESRISELEGRYSIDPASHDRSERFVRSCTRLEFLEYEQLSMDLDRMTGKELVRKYDLKFPPETVRQLAYWRNPYGLHALVLDQFHDMNDVNCMRLVLSPDDLRKIVGHLENASKDFRSDIFPFFGREDFWDMQCVQDAHDIFNGALSDYSENDVIFYWSWY